MAETSGNSGTASPPNWLWLVLFGTPLAGMVTGGVSGRIAAPAQQDQSSQLQQLATMELRIQTLERNREKADGYLNSMSRNQLKICEKLQVSCER